jgi:hypothetical protein
MYHVMTLTHTLPIQRATLGGPTDGEGGVLSIPGLSDIDKTETTHRYI